MAGNGVITVIERTGCCCCCCCLFVCLFASLFACFLFVVVIVVVSNQRKQIGLFFSDCKKLKERCIALLSQHLGRQLLAVYPLKGSVCRVCLL